MGYALQVFVSSACYELRDLRSTIRSWLMSLGMNPVMSDEAGFPHSDGMPPFATCLEALEKCPLVIVVIDRFYGSPFDEWGPYPQHRGRAPTHAELIHALDAGKRVLIYVQNDMWAFYEAWRKNADLFNADVPRGLDVRNLQLMHELKKRSPTPWMAKFGDAADLQKSLNAEFINQLAQHFAEREKQTTDLASYMLDKIEQAAPEIREKIMAQLSPELVSEGQALKVRLVAIEAELASVKGSAVTTIQSLEDQKAKVQSLFDDTSHKLKVASLLTAQAMLKDVKWLEMVRKQMQPPNGGRVPFHHTTEVAIRGFKTAGGQRKKPVLTEVTWSLLPEYEQGLNRGYKAGTIFRGADFVPGITYMFRRRGNDGLPMEQTDQWLQPATYYGDYLELPSNVDEIEGPLNWRGYEFQLKNPDGPKSEWVPFSYPFDDVLISKLQKEYLEQGQELLLKGKLQEAQEPLRRAFVYADRLYGMTATETLAAKESREKGIADARLAQLRFRKGDHLTVKAGNHTGQSGEVVELLLNHFYAYRIKPVDGEPFQVADNEVERAP